VSSVAGLYPVQQDKLIDSWYFRKIEIMPEKKIFRIECQEAVDDLIQETMILFRS